MIARWRRLRGLLRSLAMYYWPPGSGRRLDAFYRPLVPDGGLCFDIGAHVGNRTACWRRLGARVVAVEPQPDFTRLLGRLFARDAGVTLVAAAVDRRDGAIDLHLSPATPTVTTASPDFIADAAAIGSFEGVRWPETVRVPALTLDSLIAEHGRPDFLKIDIEGLEEAALAGLSQPVPLLSFEFLAGAVPRARAAIARLDQLADWRFNVSKGESLAFEFDAWVHRAALEDWLDGVAGEDFSGDIYARLER
ncbi:MAG: FkbM family methyltransferase [Alphaproteobacteria bacterium]|jgi:FkbM family methyltransferase|nr:FkbM family methyltransferase [Alphaproteobacteria bacterium]